MPSCPRERCTGPDRAPGRGGDEGQDGARRARRRSVASVARHSLRRHQGRRNGTRMRPRLHECDEVRLTNEDAPHNAHVSQFAACNRAANRERRERGPASHFRDGKKIQLCNLLRFDDGSGGVVGRARKHKVLRAAGAFLVSFEGSVWAGGPRASPRPQIVSDGGSAAPLRPLDQVPRGADIWR